MRKMAVILAVCMLVASLSVGTAQAAIAWYNCTISSAGSTATSCSITVTATGGTFTNRKFLLDKTDPAREKIFYATALTAMSTTGKVLIGLDTAHLAEYSTCYGVFIVQ